MVLLVHFVCLFRLFGNVLRGTPTILLLLAGDWCGISGETKKCRHAGSQTTAHANGKKRQFAHSKINHGLGSQELVSITSLLRRLVRRFRFGRYDHAKVFEHIFETRYWGDRESVSGCGSSLEQTKNIRRELPIIFDKFGIRSMLDAPCGDLYWMSDVLDQSDIRYVGGDIVPKLVELASQRMDRPNTTFQVFDITTDTLPDVDLWLCRDVLFHLSNDKIHSALKNLADSNVKYLLVTSHTDPSIVNRNMVTGDFRQLDLLKEPFQLPKGKILHRFEDFAAPAPPREMLLFRREDIAASIEGRNTF